MPAPSVSMNEKREMVIRKRPRENPRPPQPSEQHASSFTSQSVSQQAHQELPNIVVGDRRLTSDSPSSVVVGKVNAAAPLSQSRHANVVATQNAKRGPSPRNTPTQQSNAASSSSTAPAPASVPRLSPFAQAKEHSRIQERQNDWRLQLSQLVADRTLAQHRLDVLRKENTVLENEVVEEMVDQHAAKRRAIRDAPDPIQTESVLRDLAQQEKDCCEAIDKYRKGFIDSEARLAAHRREVDRKAEELVLCRDELERCVLPSWEAPRVQLAHLQQEVDRLRAALVEESDATFGLSSEAAAVVREQNRLHQSHRDLQLAAAATELDRRAVCAAYEEAKGTIRVYCRVRGSANGPPTHLMRAGRVDNAAMGTNDRVDAGRPPSVDTALAAPVCASTAAAVDDNNRTRQSSTSDFAMGAPSDETTQSVVDQLIPLPAAAPQAAAARFEFPDGATERRCIAVASTRENATSTGKRESLITHEFDCVFPSGASQSEVFSDVAALVDGAVDGYQVCILAYGQTGSGKTFTMEGDFHSDEHSGVIPRTMRRVFERTQSLDKDGWSYRLTCFVVEIYNDNIRDLLNPSDAYHRACVASEGAMPGKPHEIVHKGRNDTSITNVTEVVVESLDDVRRCLESASRRRISAKTNLNERSSRSHCVFTLRLEGFSSMLKQRSLGNICLVDLAGSERVLESGVQGVQWREAVNINKSLSFLGDCICALGTPGAVVPWRNCKLTLLLQNYLGGEGAKVLMIVTVSDLEAHVSETLNSLRFATKVNHTRVGTARPRVVQTS